MTYVERERLKATEAILKESGFSVSERCCSRPSCFDYAARKSENLIFIKVEKDIDAFSPSDSLELEAISECVAAGSLLIGEKTREKPLEDDTVYSRHNVSVVTPKTFENIIIRKTHPLIQAGPGGYYVEIDSEAVKRRRQELGLSVGEMAKMIGTSRRTLYGYERGMAKASVTAAYNMVRILGIPIAKPVDVFEKSRSYRECFLTKARHVIAKYKFVQRILGKFARCNVKTVKKAPFDFVITVPEEKMRIICGVANSEERELDRRVDEILSVSRIVQAHPILIIDGQKLPNKDIVCINKEELSKMKTPEDLILNR